ncbi:unnamed protein product [Rotaria socialis]
MSSLPVKTQVSPLILVESINSSSISEFQMINSNENNNSTIGDDSCIVVTRPVLDQQGISILKTTQIHNCSRPVHVLCKSRTKISIPFRPVCYDKPLTLGLPAMISNYLTHELCLSVCKELTVDVAVVQMNKFESKSGIGTGCDISQVVIDIQMSKRVFPYISMYKYLEIQQFIENSLAVQ